MVDLTLKELQAFNDTQREIIEKQQAEIRRLRGLLSTWINLINNGCSYTTEYMAEVLKEVNKNDKR